MTDAIRIDDISKRYAGHVAVDRLSLAVPAGTIYGILGPNGAGKSTTLRMIMNIIGRDSGSISMLGADPAADRKVLRRVGYLPEERGLYKKMKVLDVIVFFAALKGVPEAQGRTQGREWLERMGLSEWENARVETLSKGMQQKVQFITTILHRPDLLILDEPASGLDPVNQEVLRDTILGARSEGRTVLFSTHNMDQAEQLCEHVCIIAEGRKVLDGNLREVKRSHMGNRYEVEFERESPAIQEQLRPGNGTFTTVTALRDGTAFELELSRGADTHTVLGVLSRIDVPILRFARVQPSLHEIFVQRVTGAVTPHRRPEEAHV
ncbi:MAG TPA: ATP-binding cassette domain-containing protein [Gemmatimonadaceae bacterium]|nr:ATP-binding cassette domain-containing protein [Gemmatimonadaceae bacterium]